MLVCLGGLAVGARGVAPGMAMTVGALMVLFVVAEGPAVECGESSVSSGSGPWWIQAPSQSSGSGTNSPDGVSFGTIQVGNHHYAYTCAGGHLTQFERAD